MASLKTWVRAARPRTLLLSFSGVLMGAFLALSQPAYYILPLVLAALTAILLQVLSNFANDYGDYKSGVDGENRVGPQREMQRGDITEKGMRKAIALTGVACLLSGLTLLVVSFVVRAADISRQQLLVEMAVFAVLGLGAVLAALFYTLGKHPYGYQGLGDLSCFVFFGLAAVGGTCYLATPQCPWYVLLPAAAMGFLSNAVLNINNMRDHDNDKANGKNSLVVKIGLRNAFYYHCFLIIGAFVCLTLYLVLNHAAFYNYAFWLLFPLFLKDLITIKKSIYTGVPDLLLPKQVRNTFLVTVLFGVLLLF